MANILAIFVISGALKTKMLQMLGVLLIIVLVKGILTFIIRKKLKDRKLIYQFRKMFNIISIIVYLAALLIIWNSEIKNLDIFLGLLSAGLAFVFKDVIINIAGWGFILVRKPFTIGDRIEVNGMRGDVIDINLLKFYLIEVGNWVDDDQSTGRVVSIPNAKIFTEVLINSSSGFDYIWNEISFYVTVESNFEKAKKILQRIGNDFLIKESVNVKEEIEEFSTKMLVYYKKTTPIVYMKMTENGVKLTLRYMCNPRRRRDTAQDIHEKVLNEFVKEKDIVFSFKTSRVINYSYELNANQESR